MMRRFNDILVETIDEVLRDTLEDEKAEIILKYFKGTSSKKVDEKLQFSADALPKILAAGSVIIEDLILETLYSKFQLELKRKKDYTFAEYIMELRSNGI